jgi:hypothetical protein
VGRQGFVLGQRFKPEHSRESGSLDLTEYGEADDGGRVIEKALQGRQLRYMRHDDFLPKPTGLRQQGSPTDEVF